MREAIQGGAELKPMHYISTRGHAAPVSFGDALLSGLAPDGGLYLPETWPEIDPPGLTSRRYADIAFVILSRFAGDAFPANELRADVEAACATFDSEDVAPLSQLADNLYLLELFHGPTLAFKDIAMQVLARLFARELARRATSATVVVATSGDTGSAAIAALGGLPRISLFVLHPKGRVSEVQRRQMTTATFGNVHNIALEGSFDDAQTIVKELFADTAFAAKARLAAVNSINFARIAAQCVYYFTVAAAFDRPPVYVVPTGNFGDVFAGEAAMRMGLPVERLVMATNANDILWRALRDGIYAPSALEHTLSPSMDIQVASNFERALFEAADRDAEWVRAAMKVFAQERRLAIPPAPLAALRARYGASRADDSQTLASMARIHGETGRLIDPHTAVALTAAEEIRATTTGPVVVLSTAHPAKFPEAVRRATGIEAPLPPRLAGLYEGVERVTTLPNSFSEVRTFIEQRSHPT